MRSFLVLSLFLSGCNTFVEEANYDATPGVTDADLAQPDADPNAPDAVSDCEWPFAPAAFDPCADVPNESDALVLNLPGVYSYDTDTGVLTDPSAAQVVHASVLLNSGRAIVAGNFQIGANTVLRPEGTRPLLIVSWSNIQVEGIIDVSSSQTGAPGAGSNPGICNPPAGNGTNNEQGAGGGAGGAFGGPGGPGGDGRDGTGGQGGNPQSSIIAVFHGGCSGAAGGDGNGAAAAGDSGAGGGAVFLIARSTTTIGGTLHAGGQGGGGSLGGRSGGGGGGSGGFVEVQTATLNVLASATVAANGGAGGGGSNAAPSTAGQSGRADGSVAIGGPGELSPSGDGGDGGYQALLAGQAGAEGQRGGGGGGGSVGRLRFAALSMILDGASLLSPAPIIVDMSQ